VVGDLDADLVRRTAEQIGAADAVTQDVRDEQSHAALAEAASRRGRLAVWVNNAGVGDDGLLAELDSAAVRRLVETNLLGTLWGMRAALAAFGPEGGDLINLGSLSGLGPVPGLSVYAATKAAVVSVSQSVSVEAPPGVRVHALCPDGVDTALVAGMAPDGAAKALVHSGGRLLTVEEVADQAVALIGSRRVVRSLPLWRGGLMRVGSVAPSVSAGGFAAMAAVGRWVIRRREG
jgi:NAD(P)-dependent dehydrogenase (short-subunit alcohol dehydrogenase family)